MKTILIIIIVMSVILGILSVYYTKNAPLVNDDGFKVPKEKEDKYLKDLQKSMDKIIEGINNEEI